MSGRGSAVVAAMEAGSLVLVSAERSAEKRDLGLNGRRLPSFQSHPFTLPETHGGEGRPVQVSGTPPARGSLSRTARPGVPSLCREIRRCYTPGRPGLGGIYPYIYDF